MPIALWVDGRVPATRKIEYLLDEGIETRQRYGGDIVLPLLSASISMFVSIQTTAED